MKGVNAVILGLFFITGCVSAKEYKARLDDIGDLRNKSAALEEKLKKTEEEKAALESELSTLKNNYAELLEEKQSLTETNAKLNFLLEANKDEKTGLENDLNSKNDQIAELKQEIEALNIEKSKAVAALTGTYDSLVSELKDEIKQGEIEVTQLRDKLSVSMVEKVLFDSGSAQIKKKGEKVLDRVANILKKVTDKEIRIEGHTDNVPIGPNLANKFPTNWELSTARATNVVRYLVEKGIDSNLLSAAGYSEYRPVAGNETETGKAKNRRIEIVLIPPDIDRVPLHEEAGKREN
jgi:chemotaxis protein MotB